MLAEEPLGMSQGDIPHTRSSRERGFSMPKPADHAHQSCARNPKPFPQLYSLRTGPFANVSLQKPLANSDCQRGAMFTGNNGMHHI